MSEIDILRIMVVNTIIMYGVIVGTVAILTTITEKEIHDANEEITRLKEDVKNLKRGCHD